MKRNIAVGSILGIILTIALFIGIGASIFLYRGLVFSPGRVSAKTRAGVTLKGFTSHAQFEKQCSSCHDPLTTNQANQCLECHTGIEQQVASGQGIHSQLSGVNQCASCHPEHKGTNFDPTKASFQLFNHSATGFSLNHHQVNYDAAPLECSSCHTGETYTTVSNQTCLDCHANHDQAFTTAHTSEYGNDCQGCHDGADRMSNFDHAQTGFVVDGKHTQAKCVDCHTKGTVADVSSDCSSCHTEPSQHENIFDPNCKSCHTTQGWSPASLNGQPFAHVTNTSFSLALHQTDYAGGTITCATCHTKDLQVLEVQTCVDCHAQHDASFMADHQEQFGTDCMTCHDGVDRLSNYNHDNFFVLDGKHSELQCAECHVDNVYRGTPSECYQCHKEPEIHTGVFGQKCYYCHTAAAWSPATMQEHDFPINHGLTEQGKTLACDTCHGSTYFEYTCYSCHDHQADLTVQTHIDAGIAQEEIPQCAKCHPAGTLTASQQTP